MRIRLAVVGAALALAVHGAAEPPPAASVYNRASPVATTGAAQATGGAGQGGPQEAAAQAERIVAGSLLTIARADSLSVRLRQKARIGDRVLVGGGRYVQSGHGEEQRFRYESMLEDDTHAFEVLEVCDGLFAWTFRHSGPEPPTLQRVDVRRLRERLEQLGAAEPVDVAPYIGGLQGSLWMLREWFRFTVAEPGVIDGTPVWCVEGRWVPEGIACILPEVTAAAHRPGGVAPAELPDGVPWSVRLSIGRSDLVLRRIEWLAIPGPRPVVTTVPEPIAVLELQDVEINGPVDSTAFFYQPATAGLMDLTDQQLQQLRLWRP
jgi:hypothetical protein